MQQSGQKGVQDWGWSNSLVCFEGISIIVGYSMPNPLYTYISNV